MSTFLRRVIHCWGRRWQAMLAILNDDGPPNYESHVIFRMDNQPMEDGPYFENIIITFDLSLPQPVNDLRLTPDWEAWAWNRVEAKLAGMGIF